MHACIPEVLLQCVPAHQPASCDITVISLQPAKDALDTMVLGATDLSALDPYTMLEHQPFDPTIKRTESASRCPCAI
jgi:hypothetical protein